MAFFAVILFSGFKTSAQDDAEKAAREAKKFMQEAEEALSENDLASAEAYYRKAIAKDPSNAEAKYNLGNLYYNKEITNEAVQRHGQAAKVTEKKDLKHDSFHNRGNAFMKQKKYKEAIEAYKNSLRNNPSDDETRYNLALAKKMLEEEQKQGGGDKNQDQKQDKQDQNKDQEQQDQKKQEGDEGEKEKNEDGKPQDEKDQGGEKDQQDKKEGEDKKDEEGKPQNKDKQEQNQGDEKQEKQPQPRPGQLSPQQVKNLLEAMGNEEKKVQDKINAEKVKGAKTKTEKDW